uniref:TSA: Wollemia nobilis Ref_Wollemi_Transcript_15863_1639 transcribed RNA sequence n=1 Tax=Wollemia nobilis TaxID=56998 RepID=A0A0C9S602_9CONI
MDGNKDDAQKCLNIGKAAIAAGDVQRARKFLAKARRLDPSLSVDEHLAACNGENGKEPETPTSNPSENTETNEVNSMKVENSNGNSSSRISKGYNEEQLEIVLQIKRNKDYYAILGLEKSCSVEEVRKAYRKLSLKVHPDKNKAPGAEEAFKAVSKAFQCLSDEEMRRNYDITGPPEDFELQQQQHYARRRRTHQGFYGEEFDPDEIFRQFFFGGGQNDFFSRTHVARARAAAASQGGRTHDGGFNMFTLLQVLPILILFLVTYLPYNEPLYSMDNSYPYQYRKVTKEFGVQYFVKSVDFDKEYPPDTTQRANLELHVIRDYRNHLARYCQVELQRRQWTGQKETPFCDKLRQFERVR